MRSRLGAAIVAILLVPTAARADFGDRGTIAIDGGVRADVIHRRTPSASGFADSTSSTQLGLGVRAHWFVVDAMSVGAGAFVGRRDGFDRAFWDLEGSVHAGGHHAFSPRWHLWPRVALQLVREETYYPAPDVVVEFAWHTVRVELQLPLLYEPAPHFFLGLAPTVTQDLINEPHGAAGVSRGKRLELALRAVIGGYFGD